MIKELDRPKNLKRFYLAWQRLNHVYEEYANCLLYTSRTLIPAELYFHWICTIIALGEENSSSFWKFSCGLIKTAAAPPEISDYRT